MRAFEVETVPNGDYLVPHPLNHELAEAVEVFHTLDTWNFDDNVVLVAKTALGAWGKIETFGHDDIMAVQLSAEASRHDIYPIPTDANVPWVEEVETGDCMLHVTFGACVSWGTGAIDYAVWLGVKVDGTMVCRTGPSAGTRYMDHPDLHGEIALGAGVHRVEMVFGVVDANETIGVGQDLDFLDRVLTLREVAR